MQIRRRRLTFQLTPLLDLLLIVIFAQYMEVQQASQHHEVQAAEQKSNLEQQYVQRRLQLERELAAQRTALDVQRQRYSEQFQSLLKQNHQAATALTKTFRLPGRLLEETLRLRNAGRTAEAEQIEQALAEIDQLLQARDEDLLQFMIRFDEMQKHVSVWEVHVLENGQAEFTDGTVTRRLVFESVDGFSGQALEASKSFAEPRPLTLILMSHGDSQIGFRRMVTEGLPRLTQALRDDAGGTRWYDYSLLGFRPDGPVLGSN